jgi:hypothetical protein
MGTAAPPDSEADLDRYATSCAPIPIGRA